MKHKKHYLLFYPGVIIITIMNPISKKNTIFFVLNSCFLAGLAIDLYVPSLPIIQSDFQVKTQFVQFTISIYLLGYGLGQFFLGLTSDSVGRKKIAVASSFFYMIISLLAAFSYNIYFLIAFRLIQGVFLGGLISTCRALMTDCFSGISLTKMMTYLSACWALGPILGPFIGSNLQHYFNWQTNFYFFSLYGLIIWLSSLKLPEIKIDLIHRSQILINIKYVSKHFLFLYCTLFLAFIYSIIVIFNIVGPFLIQDILKYSVKDFGHIALIMGFGYFLGTLTNRFLLNHFKPKSISLFGVLCALIMSLIMILIDSLTKMNIYTVTIPTFILFYFCGISFVNIMSYVMRLFPKIAGITSAVFGLFFAGTNFLIISLATLIKTNTQTPTSIAYSGLLAVCLYVLFFKIKKQN